MPEKDTYNTIAQPSPEVIFKDRGSKFLGYAFPVTDETAARQQLQQVKASHVKARHWCYAWQFGTEKSTKVYRVNDDGEPKNSAGQPIYGQILSKDLTNILVVVVRYFGGTKLGVGGLINAYKTTAEMALDTSKIVERTVTVQFKLVFAYKDMNTIMRVIKERNIRVIQQRMDLNCELVVSVRKNEATATAHIFEGLRCLKFIRC